MDKYDERAEKIREVTGYIIAHIKHLNKNGLDPQNAEIYIIGSINALIAASIREAVEEAVKHVIANHHFGPGEHICQMEQEKARASALEEAAKVAETTEAKENSIAWQAHKNIASEIRALAKETK